MKKLLVLISLFSQPYSNQSDQGIGLAVVLLLRESSAQHPAKRQDILDPFSETDNSSILLSLMTFTIQLMVGVPRMTGTLDLKGVKSGMRRNT